MVGLPRRHPRPLTLLFLSGLPIAFSFTLFNFIAVYFWMGGSDSFSLLAVSAFSPR